jgi:hypothetical protein
MCAWASDWSAVVRLTRVPAGTPAASSSTFRTNEFPSVPPSRQPIAVTVLASDLFDALWRACANAGAATPIAAAIHTPVYTLRFT